jgi:metal-responsive CopG/Arc/MetJ family transcriptional regulator
MMFIHTFIMSSTSARKVRLTITMSPDLLETIDRSVRPGESRSSVIESWLRSATRRRAHDLLAAETEAYYEAITAAESAEDLALSRATAQALSVRNLDTNRPSTPYGRKRPR